MPLSITSRRVRQFCVLEVAGDLMFGPSLNNLSVEAKAAIASAPATGLLVDLTAVKHMDSAGLGELVVTHSLMADLQCPLVLVGPNRHLRQFLQITRLDGLFPCFENEAGAIASLSQESRS